MARLSIRLHGEEINVITLESGREYIAGRAPEAQIKLPNEKGISRQHLKFYEKDSLWICESLSKFVPLQKGNQALEVLELSEPTVFSLPPFEFRFELSEPLHPPNPILNHGPSSTLPTPYLPLLGSHAPVGEHTTGGVNSEATRAGSSSSTNLVPYFKVSLPNANTDDVFKLEGQVWIAGRDPNCEIHIDSPHMSRKHFELARTEGGFFITDLGSSNGTYINGHPLVEHEPSRLGSGDEITVKNIKMNFEIRDANFNQRLEHNPLPAFDPSLNPPPMDRPPSEASAQYFQSTGEEPEDWNSGSGLKHAFRSKKMIMRGALVSVIVIIGIAMLLPSSPPPAKETPTANGNTSVTFDRMTIEQKSVIKDSFSLARNLYVSGKYELCLAELAKVHDLIPMYESSKELQSFCEQGRELLVRERDLERKNRERAQIEQQLAGYIDQCKAQLKPGSSVDETRQCLAEAIELDPEHHSIVEMINNAQMHATEKKFADDRAKVQAAKIKNALAHLKRAQALYKNGQLNKAADEYEKLINSPYSQSPDIKGSAQRDLASIKKTLKTKIDTLVEKCKTLHTQNRYKEAYTACEEVLLEDNKQAEPKRIKEQIVLTLRKNLKGIYEDSVLEESLGNGDTAKEKWKQIIKEDLPQGEYAVKARGKLLKYEAGP